MLKASIEVAHWAKDEVIAFELMARGYFGELEPSVLDTPNWLENYVRTTHNDKEANVWWAMLNGEKVGFVVFRFSFHKYRSIKLGHIEETYIQPDARGKGMGRFLIEQVLDYMRSQQIRRIDLGVLSNNQSAIYFWESLGFHEHARYFRMNVEQPE